MGKFKDLFCGLLAFLAAALLAGCRTVKHVPVGTVRTGSVHAIDSSVVNTVIRYKDSLRVKDSVVIVVDTAGNVLSKEKYHDEEHTKDTGRSNSETKSKEAKSTDRVQVPVFVERELDWWQQVRLKLFWPLAAVSVVMVVAVLLSVYVKLKKKQP